MDPVKLASKMMTLMKPTELGKALGLVEFCFNGIWGRLEDGEMVRCEDGAPMVGDAGRATGVRLKPDSKAVIFTAKEAEIIQLKKEITALETEQNRLNTERSELLTRNQQLDNALKELASKPKEIAEQDKPR